MIWLSLFQPHRHDESRWSIPLYLTSILLNPLRERLDRSIIAQRCKWSIAASFSCSFGRLCCSHRSSAAGSEEHLQIESVSIQPRTSKSCYGVWIKCRWYISRKGKQGSGAGIILDVLSLYSRGGRETLAGGILSSEKRELIKSFRRGQNRFNIKRSPS